MFASNANAPTAVLLVPVEFAVNAYEPTAVLSEAVVGFSNAL